LELHLEVPNHDAVPWLHLGHSLGALTVLCGRANNVGDVVLYLLAQMLQIVGQNCPLLLLFFCWKGRKTYQLLDLANEQPRLLAVQAHVRVLVRAGSSVPMLLGPALGSTILRRHQTAQQQAQTVITHMAFQHHMFGHVVPHEQTALLNPLQHDIGFYPVNIGSQQLYYQQQRVEGGLPILLVNIIKGVLGLPLAAAHLSEYLINKFEQNI
jgi:hypothetical protein